MATVYLRKEETTESLIRRWKKKVEKEGIMEDMNKHDYYVAPSEKRRLKKKESQKRIRLLEKKLAKYRKNDR